MSECHCSAGADWRSELAIAVHKLVRRYGVGSFHQQVQEWQDQYEARCAKADEQDKRRRLHFLKALRKPRWRDPNAKPPRKTWMWSAERISKRDGTSVYVQAWTPPELARVEEPKLPLPIVEEPEVESDVPPPPRVLSLPEKYAALSVVHDKYWREGEPIIARPDTVPLKPWVKWLSLADAEPADQDEPILREALEEVTAHLAGEPPGGKEDMTKAAESLSPALEEGDEQAELQRLACEIPLIDDESEDWISNKAAANLLNVDTETLANHRGRGQKLGDDDRSCGLHEKGCFWRKRGSEHPKYYLPRMQEHAGHLRKIYTKARLDSSKNRHRGDSVISLLMADSEEFERSGEHRACPERSTVQLGVTHVYRHSDSIARSICQAA